MGPETILTRLLIARGQGHEEARDKLIRHVYTALSKTTQRQLSRLRPGQTLDVKYKERINTTDTPGFALERPPPRLAMPQ